MVEQLRWYARRLRAMSPREVAERARRMPVHHLDAALYRLARPVWRLRWEPSTASLLRSASADTPVGLLQPDRAAALKERLPAEAETLLARADALIEGRYQFFGCPEVRAAADTSEGDVDPFTKRPWPSTHGKRIDYRRDAPGDPKWIWELNRCQDLPVLAAAWLISGSRRYGEAACGRLLSWIRSHPPGRGIAWSNGFEAGMRAISLAVTFDALRGSGLLSADEQGVTLRALWQHGRWIERDPATGSSANNHRIGDLVGLVVIGSLAPELIEGKSWLERGAEELGREAERQIRPDGTNVEQAFAYQLFVIDLLLVATAALDCAGHQVPARIVDALERSGDALWAQLGSDEPAPTYGDADDGRAIVLDGRSLRDPRGVAAAIAARFAHPASARAAAGLDAAALLLFGREGAERLGAIAPAPAPGSVILPDGGLAILRSERRRAMLDFGPHGYLSIAAHAHADALSVDVSLGESGLIVDPGVGSYFARPEMREAFRSTAFHATVTVDGVSSSVPGGPFLWSRHARSSLLVAELEGAFVVAEHDGYMRLEDPVLHRRALVLVDDAVVVLDRLRASGAHHYSQRWPLHPELAAVGRDGESVVGRGDRAGVVLALAASQPFRVTTARGEREPLAGWWSERLESVVPSWLVASDADATGELEMAALIVPFDSATAPEVGLRMAAGEQGTRLDVTIGQGEACVEIDLAAAKPRVRRLAEVKAG